MRFLAVLAPIVVFGLVIFVHELGHFLAAKSVGVYTPRFSIGFGPALWRRRKGETEYILAALPLGGYVRMASRHDEATAFLEGGSEEAEAAKLKDHPDQDPNAMIPFGPKPVPEHRWFESKPLWARLYILLAGVTMNFLLGLLVNIVLAAYLGNPILTTTSVGSVRPVQGRPLLAAIQAGDTVRRVNGEAVTSWNQVVERIRSSRERVIIETNRGTTMVELNPAGGPSALDVARGLDVLLPPVFGEVLRGDPASKAGLAKGDSVIAIDGQPIRSWNEMVRRVSSSPGRPLAISVIRDGQSKTMEVTPRGDDGTDPVTGAATKVGRIGVAVKDVSVREPISFLAAIRVGAADTWAMSTAIVRFVRNLFTDKAAFGEVGGFIAITQASFEAARMGLPNFLFLIALLSVNVGIINLLPIPVLDGGQVVINVLETAKGKPFSVRTREYILRVALAMILLLLVLTTYNDIRRVLKQWLG